MNKTTQTRWEFLFSCVQAAVWIRRPLRQALHLKLEFTRFGGSGHDCTGFICAVAAWLWSFSWGSMGRCEGGGVLRWRWWGVWLWRLSPIIKSPEQREGERHGQDLSHTDGHTQETQHLQLLRPSNKTVDLWTTSLKHKQESAISCFHFLQMFLNNFFHTSQIKAVCRRKFELEMKIKHQKFILFTYYRLHKLTKVNSTLTFFSSLLSFCQF